MEQKALWSVYKIVSATLTTALLIPIFAYVLTPEAYGVTDIEWNNAESFSVGVFTQSTTTEDTITLTHDMEGAVFDDTEVELGNEHEYNFANFEGVGGIARHSYLDETNGLLYVAVEGSPLGGVVVVDTKETYYDATDDESIFHYATSTSPSIEVPSAHHVYLDTNTNLLYISVRYGGGLTVIDTLGNANPADDVVVKTYKTDTVPAIAGNDVLGVDLDMQNNLIYVQTHSGVSVLNTFGTKDPADDVLVGHYRTDTSPAIVNNIVYSAFLDNELLYVNTPSGISVINTYGTVTLDDDTLVTHYSATSMPALCGNGVRYSFLDTERNLLYASVDSCGVSVINTQGTTDPGDDELVITYNSNSSPSISANYSWSSVLDTDHNLLYVASHKTDVINTQGTIDPSDDELVDQIDACSSHSLMYSQDSDVLYTSSYCSIVEVSIRAGRYLVSSEIAGPPHRIGESPTTTLTYTRTLASDHTTLLQYRSGDETSVYDNEFDDDLTTEFVGDYYDWGHPFQVAEEIGGTLKLSDPNTRVSDANSWVDSWIYLGAEYPADSVITARIRINSDTRLSSSWDDVYIYTNDWWDAVSGNVTNNEWTIFTLTAEDPFSYLGFEANWQTDTWAPTDTFEIDYIRIETPDSFGGWNDWSDPCTTTTCAIDPNDLTGNTWIQYKLNLETDNPETTPIVHSVAYTNGYHATGTYMSNNETINRRHQPLTFSADDTTPEGTTITYAYSTDSGSTWYTLSNPHTFDSSFIPSTFMWKADLSTDSATQTPSIASAMLTMGTKASPTGTAISRRVQSLEADGKFIEANLLRTKYPHLFTDLPKDTRQLEQIVSLLKEVVVKLEMIGEIRAREGIE
jgi:hypothetical protein